MPRSFAVVKVTDGDTFTVVGKDGIQLSIRLRGIDAPELDQAYGPQARQALCTLLAVGHVVLEEIRKGKYGRYVANVTCAKTPVNKRMLQLGFAWCYPADAAHRQMRDSELKAREHGLGLWQDESPVPPWRWRDRRR